MSSCSPLRFRTPLEKAGLLIVLAALSGCDIPTDLPIFDVGLVIPVEGTSIAVDSLLPSNVTVVGGNFEVVPNVVVSESLGSLCPPPTCVGSGGVPVPKPAFSQTINQTGNLPADVVSVELVSGSISLAVQNDLGFDPINPATAPANPGTFTVTLYDTDITGRQLGQVMWNGPTNTLPTGLTTMVPINLTAGTVSSMILAVVDLVSPAGDDVPIDLLAGFTVTVGTVSVSSATLDVDGLALSETTQAGLEEIDESVTDRILDGGSVILDIQNPFGVGFDMDLEIFSPGPDTTLTRAVSISIAANSSVTLDYTGDEFRCFLGQPDVELRVVGRVVSPGGAPATVTPTQVLVIGTTVDLVLQVGGDRSITPCGGL